MSGFRKRTDSTRMARALYSLPCLASVHLVGGLTGRGLYDRPLTPPVVREAPQAPRSLTGEKRDLEPSESVHLEFVVSLPAVDTAMSCRSTVSTTQPCGTVVNMSGMSAFFRRCVLHASQMIALEGDRNNKIRVVA